MPDPGIETAIKLPNASEGMLPVALSGTAKFTCDIQTIGAWDFVSMTVGSENYIQIYAVYSNKITITRSQLLALLV